MLYPTCVLCKLPTELATCLIYLFLRRKKYAATYVPESFLRYIPYYVPFYILTKVKRRGGVERMYTISNKIKINILLCTLK